MTPNVPDVVPAPTGSLRPASRAEAFRQFRERHHIAFEIAFFFAGFLFDVVLLHRIDSTPLLIHQGTYLVLSAGLLFIDHRILVSGKEPEGFKGKLASYRLWMMHFFLGTLLNAFLVFYFRASSGFFAGIFLVALAGVIVLNELPQFRKQGPIVRVALLSFSVTSYLAYLLPVLWGELRSWQYLTAVAMGSIATVVLWVTFRKFTKDPLWTVQRAVVPGLIVQAVLAVLYIADAIPPVPLSLKHIGLYHSVTVDSTTTRKHYTLTSEAPSHLLFWRDTSSSYTALPGEKVFAFVRIFAPARFADRVSFAWEFHDPKKGWIEWGKPFPLALTGGNEEGYRTFASTTLSRAGDYRVHVLSADGREIGNDSFTVNLISDPIDLQLQTEVD